MTELPAIRLGFFCVNGHLEPSIKCEYIYLRIFSMAKKNQGRKTRKLKQRLVPTRAHIYL